MPIYEYRCKGCDHSFERLHSSADEAIPDCPECKSKKVKRLMSVGSVRPKGIASGSGGFEAPKCKYC